VSDRGVSVGDFVGESVGDLIGCFVGESVGDLVGCFVGESVGDLDGESVGESDGNFVGATEWASDGDFVGATEGASDEDFVGATEGASDGATEGDSVGVLHFVGAAVVGVTVGEAVGIFPSQFLSFFLKVSVHSLIRSSIILFFLFPSALITTPNIATRFSLLPLLALLVFLTCETDSSAS